MDNKILFKACTRLFSCFFLIFILGIISVERAIANKSIGNAILQLSKISGKITENGEPLPGISVQRKGISGGVISNVRGEYSINAKKGDILVFSGIGYITQEIRVGESQVIDIELKVNIAQLEEVVVVGYGVQKKSDITNSVTSVDFEDLQNIPQTDVMNMLSGRVAGLSVVQASGQPGGGDDGNDITIRGVGTLNDATPLFIIDGVQSEASDFRMLSANDISSVTVLKDASSTAIYGARGANGVILVTTKAPKEGRFTVNVNSYLGRQKETVTPRFTNAWQYMTLHLEASGKPELYPLEAIEALKNGIYTDTFSYYNPVKDVFRGALQQSNNVSLTGGTKVISFRGSVNYLNQTGVLYGTYGDRVNYRASIVANISPKVKFEAIFMGGKEKSHENAGGVRGIMQNLYRAPIITPKFYSNGDWGVYNLHTKASILPPALYAQIGRRDQEILTANIVPSITYIPIKNLVLKSSFSSRTTNRNLEIFDPTYTFNVPGNLAVAKLKNTLTDQRVNINAIQFTSTANYTYNLNRQNRFTFLLGYEYLDTKISNTKAKGSDLPNNEQQVLSRAATNISITGTKEEWKLQSYFGRLNYSLKNRYFFESNLRADGSSRFPSNKQYVLLPSVSAGWMISNEKFFSQSAVGKKIDQLKLRGGWGRVGNDKMEPGRGQLGNYTHLQTYNLENYYYFGGEIIAGAAKTAYANERISWEATTTKGMGLDMSLLKKQVDITFDVYERITDGILFRVPLPPSFGTATAAVQNVAKVANRGWELSAVYNYNKRKKSNINFYIGGNIGSNDNEVVSIGGEEIISDPFILRAGEAYNSYYGWVADGIMKDASEKNYTMNGRGDIGNLKFKDLNNDGFVDDKDRTILGSSNIPIGYGINGGFNYKAFNLSFLLQGVHGKKIYIKDWGNRPGDGAVMNFWAEWWDNRYDATTNPEGTWPRMARSNVGAGETSSFWIHDASYLRLKNIELGYTLPSKLTQRLSLTKARVYLAGQNLLTFTGLIKQIDPERRAMEASNTTYSQVKVITGGINLSF